MPYFIFIASWEPFAKCSIDRGIRMNDPARSIQFRCDETTNDRSKYATRYF